VKLPGVCTSKQVQQSLHHHHHHALTQSLELGIHARILTLLSHTGEKPYTNTPLTDETSRIVKVNMAQESIKRNDARGRNTDH